MPFSTPQLVAIVIVALLASPVLVFLFTFWRRKGGVNLPRRLEDSEEQTYFVRRPYQANGRHSVKAIGAAPVVTPLAITADVDLENLDTAAWLYRISGKPQMCDNCQLGYHRNCVGAGCACPRVEALR